MKRDEFERTLDLGIARLDVGRRARTGLPEAIYAEGKTAEELSTILAALRGNGELVLVTRLSEKKYAALEDFEDLHYHPRAQLLTMGPLPETEDAGIVICAAGTSDLAVAEEAALTLEAFGFLPTRLYDIGVAGLHRLLRTKEILEKANIILVVAGMEGALLSVVTGLVHAPVIGIPTSVGYGASFHGLAALLSMLNSCAPGSAIVNIDNGFGAAHMAIRILNSKKSLEVI